MIGLHTNDTNYGQTFFFNIPVFFSFDTLCQNRTAKHRHIELQRAECKKYRKGIY